SAVVLTKLESYKMLGFDETDAAQVAANLDNMYTDHQQDLRAIIEDAEEGSITPSQAISAIEALYPDLTDDIFSGTDIDGDDPGSSGLLCLVWVVAIVVAVAMSFAVVAHAAVESAVAVHAFVTFSAYVNKMGEADYYHDFINDIAVVF